MNSAPGHYCGPAAECADAGWQIIGVAVEDTDLFHGYAKAISADLGHYCFVSLAQRGDAQIDLD